MISKRRAKWLYVLTGDEYYYWIYCYGAPYPPQAQQHVLLEATKEDK